MPGEYNAIKSFEKYTNEVGNWEDIKKKCLYLGIKEEAEQDLIQRDTQELKALIKHRDIIDFYIYRRSVERIFPSASYNLSARVNGELEYQDDQPRFKTAWYEFIITSRAELLRAGEELPSCQIKVNAPGSRNLTSDIDTSIGTKFTGNITKLLENARQNIQNKGPDFSGRITNHIVDGFYTISEQEFGITSGEHRDSNAYVELLDEDEYPKFKNNEARNPIVGGIQLFKNEEFVHKLAEYKRDKHILEMAASLFSLRDALEEKESKEEKESTEWVELKTQINTAVDNCAKQFVWDEQLEKHYPDISKKDLKAVFEKTEHFFSTYEKHLSKKIKEIEESDYGKHSKLQGSDKARDFKVAALNRLYVEFLEMMTDVNGKILTLKGANYELSSQIEDLQKKLQKEQKRLANFKLDPETHNEDIPESEIKCADLRNEYEAKLKSLKENLISIADMQIKKLEVRYQAHTFANEAYVCRSAVYHVVNGMQQSGSVNISEQTLLGSLLQQVGFKLLHTKELLKRDKSPEEAIYRTSKYSQRIKHLLVNKQDTTNENVQRALNKEGPNNLGIFSKLKSTNYKDRLFKIFSYDELALINTEPQVVPKIKNNPNLLEKDKPRETANLLREANVQSSKPLFLSIASKAIAGTYLSKLDRKGALWGAAGQQDQTKPANISSEKSETQKQIELKMDTSKSQLSHTAASKEDQSGSGALMNFGGAQFNAGLELDNQNLEGPSIINAQNMNVKNDAKIKNTANTAKGQVQRPF